MFSRDRPQQRRRKPITAKQLNIGHDLLSRLERMRTGGRGTISGPFGPLGASDGIDYQVGYTGSDGIPASTAASGSGPALLGYSEDVQTVDFLLAGPGQVQIVINQDTFDGYNLSQSSVAPNAFTIYMSFNGVWLCVWEDCPAGS